MSYKKSLLERYRLKYEHHETIYAQRQKLKKRTQVDK